VRLKCALLFFVVFLPVLIMGLFFIWSICFFLKQKISAVVNTNTTTIKRTRHCTCVLFVRFVRLKCARLKSARLKNVNCKCANVQMCKCGKSKVQLFFSSCLVDVSVAVIGPSCLSLVMVQGMRLFSRLSWWW